MQEAIIQSILDGQRPAIPFAHDIVDLENGRVVAREILTRFRDEEGQVVTVGKLLEDVTLAPELRARLDIHCLSYVFEALACRPVTEHLIFINLDPLTLRLPLFWDRLQPWLWNLTIPPHRLVLEITESFGGWDQDELRAQARRLRNLGFRIAVDDLGSGVASLSHMARLCPDFIKADRSLVHQVHRRPYQAALLNALAVFAERMRVGYIAEGIETKEEMQTVKDAGVPWGQGYAFGEPEPLTL